MKVYIHECADSTLLLSESGQVLGVFSSIEDAHDGCWDDIDAAKEIYLLNDLPLLDTAA